MPAYDRTFVPPAPVADVVVAHATKRARKVALRGKLDTGADVTVIPNSVAASLEATAKGWVWIRGFDGTFSRRAVYYLRMTVEGHALPAVRCVAAERRDVLLGRNVLNRFTIVLDGKRSRFTIAPA